MTKIKNESAPEYDAKALPSITITLSDDEVVAQALKILSRRIVGSNALTSPDLVRDFITVSLAARQDEFFGVIYLDNQHRVIKTDELFRGTIDGASVYPRVVVRECLMVNAAAVIFYHNHPSGISTASEADRLITQRLKQALNLVDIRVLDHLIVGTSEIYSFAEHGLI
jgi:DNA repair protein RadC